jgi:hypothetical protein
VADYLFLCGTWAFRITSSFRSLASHKVLLHSKTRHLAYITTHRHIHHEQLLAQNLVARRITILEKLIHPTNFIKMAERDGQYDPYIPASGAAPAGTGTSQSAPGNQRTAALQAVSRIIFSPGRTEFYSDMPADEVARSITIFGHHTSCDSKRDEPAKYLWYPVLWDTIVP